MNMFTYKIFKECNSRIFNINFQQNDINLSNIVLDTGYHKLKHLLKKMITKIYTIERLTKQNPAKIQCIYISNTRYATIFIRNNPLIKTK